MFRRDKVARGLSGLAGKIPAEMQLSTRLIDLNGSEAVAIFDRGGLDRIYAFGFAESQIASIRVLINPDKLVHLARSLGTEPRWESPFALPAVR